MASTDTDRTISCMTCGDRFATVADSIDHLPGGVCTRAAHQAIRVACATVAHRYNAVVDCTPRDTDAKRLADALADVTITVAGPRRLRATILPGHRFYANSALDTGLDINLADPRIGIAQDIADKAEIIVIDQRTHELTW